MELSLFDFELIIMPGRNPSSAFSKYYDAAYDCWQKVWVDASSELEDFSSTLYANDFLAQEEVHAVFYRGECTSLGFWTSLDLSHRASVEHSYFKNWNECAISKLTENGNQIAKYSFFTVAKSYRKWAREHGFKFPDLQVALFGMRLRESECSAMTGTTRNNRKINEVCIRGGAKAIEKNLEQHGVNIDLLAWYRDEFLFNSEIYAFAKNIWSRRKIDIRCLKASEIRNSGSYDEKIIFNGV